MVIKGNEKERDRRIAKANRKFAQVEATARRNYAARVDSYASWRDGAIDDAWRQFRGEPTQGEVAQREARAKSMRVLDRYREAAKR